MSFQVPPKMFRVNSWISQIIQQWIPDSWSGDGKSTASKCAACANTWNRQLTTSGRQWMLATGNYRRSTQ